MPYTDDNGELWAGEREVMLRLPGDEYYYHRGADSILGQHEDIRASIKACVEGVEQVVCLDRSNGRKAIDPYDLNLRLRQTLDATEPEWVFEADVDPAGVILPDRVDTTAKRGFDAALCDMEANVARLRNYCFGRVHAHDGEAHWRRTLERYPILAETFEGMGTPPRAGKDWEVPKRSPTVLLEIEFANSARQQRDFFKALQAATLTPVDLFIFLTLSTTNQSNKRISDGTVSHRSVRKQLVDYPRVITIDTWAAGIVVEGFGRRTRDLTPEEVERHRRNARNPAGA